MLLPYLLLLPFIRAQSSSSSASGPVLSRTSQSVGPAAVTSSAAVVQPTTLTLSTTLTSFVATSSQTSSAGVQTAVPSPTASADAVVPYAPLPPVQSWCEGGGNASYCPGALLQAVQLSQIFGDSKTFPDKPTVNSSATTFAEFSQLPQNVTIGQIQEFVESSFKGEGLEIVPVSIQGFVDQPEVLDEVEDQIYKGWVSIVNGYWSLLIRETNSSALCAEGEGGCDSSLIPLNHTIVVPGGRYREVYYWDSFWILEGLLRSELYTYSLDLLENFMDLVETFGFVPNGGRKYYLNRSQPPVFTLMVNAYVQATGNTTVLERALPLLEVELEFWRANRTIPVTSPYTGQNHTIARYDVSINTAPRAEGYLEDFETAFGASPALNETQRSELYAELATGAESGWDYSSRWCKEPLLNVTDNLPALRTLNTRAIIPVDLNAILYGDHVILADLYETYMNGSQGNATDMQNMTAKVAQHRMIANETRAAILDLMWDSDKSYFYDFNTTANERSDLFHAGGLFPLWQNITPPEIETNETAALKVFEGIRYIAGRYPGSPSVATLLQTGLNWDFPNVWPPHTYTSIKALESIGRLYPNGTVLNNVTSTDFSAIPSGQLGLNQSELPPQIPEAVGPNSQLFADNVAEIQAGKPWWQALAIEYANRYMQSSFCSWYSTGGSIPGLLQPLSQDALNAVGASPSDSGHMFEKFNGTDVDAAGGGGEYAVVIGFGWTNGVVLWTAGEYGQYLATPACPLIAIVEANSTVTPNNTTSAAFRQYQGHRLNFADGQ